MKNNIILVLLIHMGVLAQAQEQDTASADPYITKEFVIVSSTKSYKQALTTARAAAQKIKSPLKLRGLKPAKNTGLTFSKKDCEDFGWPCYIARGRYDDGVYTSIEFSTQYEGFAEGYYIVIVASGTDGGTPVNATLEKAKAVFPDAYKKKSKVYVGCIH